MLIKRHRRSRGRIGSGGRRRKGLDFKAIVRLITLALVLGAWATRVHADPGVTASTILIGESAAFSGPAAELGNEMRAGAMAYFRSVNAAGGVNGRKIELRTLDDGYESDL